MMLVEETTVPSEALPVRQFAEHLRLGSGFADDGLQDGLLESYLRASLAAVEANTGKILIERPFSYKVFRWLDEDIVALPVAPVSEVTSLDLVDAGGTSLPAGRELWAFEPDTHRALIRGPFGYLPPIPSHGHALISFVAGYGPTWDNLPADLAQAVLTLAAHFYENRAGAGDRQPHMPASVTSLIARHRRLRIGGRF